MASGGSAEQAPGHMSAQAAEFKALIASLSAPEKKVAAMHARLLKHFGGAGTAPIVHWVSQPRKITPAWQSSACFVMAPPWPHSSVCCMLNV